MLLTFLTKMYLLYCMHKNNSFINNLLTNKKKGDKIEKLSNWNKKLTIFKDVDCSAKILK